MGRMTVRIDDDLEERVWKYIKKKYPKPHGKLQLVVAEALDEFLTKRGVK